MSVYYNEIEPYCVEWLKNLMHEGLIAKGDVDDRSIKDVKASDVKGYTQCHWFAGIGAWSYSLRQAGWADDREVWTGSCPCQGFSVAGKRLGFADERHLWPFWEPLIRECAPAAVLGEQVTGAADWLNLVRSDLEALGYAVGAVPIQAASAGADHYRDRYWFVGSRDVADATESREGGRRLQRPRQGAGADDERAPGQPGGRGDWDVADEHVERAGEGRLQRGGKLRGPGGAEENPYFTLAHGERQRWEWRQRGAERYDSDGSATGRRQSHGGVVRSGKDESGTLAHGDGLRTQVPLRQSTDVGKKRSPVKGGAVRGVVDDPSLGWGEGWAEHEFRRWGFTAAVAGIDDRQYVECPDGKWRRLPPSGVRWLGSRIPARIHKLRAIGNSIDPRAATAFIKAFMESEYG